MSTTPSSLAALLQGFFTDRLLRQMRASPHTVASYRDTFRLFLCYAAEHRGTQPADLTLNHLDAAHVTDFLEWLEQQRHNTARTRNSRLAAIRSFFRYVALCEPAYALHCERIRAIPTKRHQKRAIDFLSPQEAQALVAAPDTSMWIGRRDRTILLLLLQTGLRISELTALRRDSVVLGTGAYVRCEGKGRKCRCTPLRPDVQQAVAAWIEEQQPAIEDPLLPSSRGSRLSSDAAQRLIHKHSLKAAETCRSLADKSVTPHVLRHSAAMALLQNGVDRSVIALWLGHESVETTQVYLHADMQLKEQALARTTPTAGPPGRYRAKDALLAYLERL